MIPNQCLETVLVMDEGCRCKAHQLHRFFRYLWNHPTCSLLVIAKELGVSHSNARQLSHRLKSRPHIDRTCPECFQVQLFGHPPVCQACGFEPTETTPPIEVRFSEQSPTNNLQVGNGLGSVTSYGEIGFENNPVIIERRAKLSIEENLIVNCKSDVMQQLKSDYPPEDVSDLAGRLVLKEVRELRARYPLLTHSKYARRQVVENVLGRLALVYPSLAPSLRSYEVMSH